MDLSVFKDNRLDVYKTIYDNKFENIGGNIIESIETHPVLISIIFFILGIAGFFLRRWLFSDMRQYSSSISIRPGLVNAATSLEEAAEAEIEIVKKRQLNTFIYFLNVPDNTYSLLCFSYRITNSEKSTSAAKNIGIFLQYPVENLISDESILDFGKGKALISFHKNEHLDNNTFYNTRIVSSLNGMAHVAYNIPSLRIGETIILGEAFKVYHNTNNRSQQNTVDSETSPKSKIKKLTQIDNFMDYFRPHITITSENAAKQTKHFDIYCFKGSSKYVIKNTLGAATDSISENIKMYCLWRPFYFRGIKLLIPIRPGRLSFVPPTGTVLFSSDLMELIVPKLRKHPGGKVYLEIDPSKSERQWTSFRLPGRAF